MGDFEAVRASFCSAEFHRTQSPFTLLFGTCDQSSEHTPRRVLYH